MKTKLLILGLFCWSGLFAQYPAVPNTTTFSQFDVFDAIYGAHGSGHLAGAFSDAVAGKFDPTYGSKTMSPQTMLGFRNYGFATIPTVTTNSISDITQTTATGGGNVTSDGGASVTAKGVCWNTYTNPTTDGYFTIDGTGTGAFTSYITGISSGLTYYVRAFAINNVGTGYGNEMTFTTTSTVYGNMYNWYVIDDSRNIAPSGWHIPTSTEINTLATYLGGASVAGGHLKEVGTAYWNSPNSGADNSSGFTARGVGTQSIYSNSISGFKNYTMFWCSDLSGGYPYGYLLSYNSTDIQWYTNDKHYGFSIRLIKDNSTDPGIMYGNNGISYTTVKMGNQVWTTQNSIETKYRDGTAISTYTDASTWQYATSGIMLTR